MSIEKKCYRRIIPAALVGLLVLSAFAQNPSPPSQTTDILQYIQQTWKVLTRSNRNLPKAAVDPKFHPGPDGKWPVYIPRTEDVQAVERELAAEIPPDDYKTISIHALPADINTLSEQGLLYLPNLRRAQLVRRQLLSIGQALRPPSIRLVLRLGRWLAVLQTLRILLRDCRRAKSRRRDSGKKNSLHLHLLLCLLLSVLDSMPADRVEFPAQSPTNYEE